jgi:hypothetical protein
MPREMILTTHPVLKNVLVSGLPPGHTFSDRGEPTEFFNGGMRERRIPMADCWRGRDRSDAHFLNKLSLSTERSDGGNSF